MNKKRIKRIEQGGTWIVMLQCDRGDDFMRLVGVKRITGRWGEAMEIEGKGCHVRAG